MKTQRRRLRKSEWVILLAPLLLLAVWLATGPGAAFIHHYVPVKLEGQMPGVRTLVFSPDGHYLVVGEEDAIVWPPTHAMRLWDVSQKKSLWAVTYSAWQGRPAFSPDGKMVAAVNSSIKLMPDPDGGMADTVVQVFDVQSGRLLHKLPAGKIGMSFRFLPDNRHILIDGQVLRLWDLQTGKVSLVISRDVHPDQDNSIALSKDKRLIAVDTGKWTGTKWINGPIKIYQVMSGHCLQKIPVGVVRQMFFSADGQLLTIFENVNHEDLSSIWHWRTGRRLLTKRTPTSICRRASPRGKSFCSQEWLFNGRGQNAKLIGSTIRCQDARTLATIWSDSTHSTTPSLLFSPDGRWIAYFEEVDKNPTWVLRSTSDGKEWRRYRSGLALMFSPDSRTLVTASGKTVKLWDVSDLTQKSH